MFCAALSELMFVLHMDVLFHWKAHILTAVNSTRGLYYKSFTILIYDCNDSGQYYKTMITIVIYYHS